MLGGGFGVVEFGEAAAVVVLADEGGGAGEFGAVAEEAGAVQMHVGEEERHRAALGDALRLVQRLPRGCGIAVEVMVQRGGEEGAGEMIRTASLAEAVEGGGKVSIRRGGGWRGVEQRAVEGDAGEGEVIEGDVEEPVVSLSDG